MNLKPIEIYCNNLQTYMRLVSVVDQDAFLEDIYRVRGKLGITELYTQEDERQLFDTKNGEQNIFLDNFDTNEVPNTRLGKLLKGMLDDTGTCKFIQNKYGLDNAWEKVIINAVFFNSIDELDTKIIFNGWSYEEIKDFPARLNDLLHPGEHMIIINNSTTEKDLLTEFRNYKLRHKIRDTISNIKRDREWYWLNKSGLGYDKIYKLEREKGNHLTEDAVRKAIKQYQKLLKPET